jgi:hypothetical protein
MLVANSLLGRKDVDLKQLFDNDLKKAAFGI